MKIRLKHLATVMILTSSFSGAARAHSSDLRDVNYSFDPTKLAAAGDSFHFLRTYVDYFYLLIAANRDVLPSMASADSFPGWCVGDAHAENFGAVILENRNSYFAMNDMDDAGQCPVPMDLMRLLVSSTLYNKDIQADDLLKSYLKGLRGDSVSTPDSIDKMIKKSQERGMAPSDKKVDGNKIIRDPQMVEISSDEKDLILQALHLSHNILSSGTRILDAVATSKVGGGSGGLLRYEILLQTDGTLLHLELKEEVRPSIYPVAVGPLPTVQQKIATALAIEQNNQASAIYQVVVINDKTMLLRPRFAGNIGVDLTKQSDSDNKDIIEYEAYRLGQIHAKSVNDSAALAKMLDGIKKDTLQDDVDSLAEQFTKKFKQLGNSAFSYKKKASSR